MNNINKINIDIQEWINQVYPQSGWTNEYGNQVNRKIVKSIHLTEPSLEGVLDFSDFTYLYLKIYVHLQVNEKQLTFTNLPTNAKVIKLLVAQTWLEKEYPKAKRSQITELNIVWKNLQGELNCSDFTNLKEISCANNHLTSLDLTNCSQLEKIYCWRNKITNLSLLSGVNLAHLDCSNNQLTSLDWLTQFNPQQLRTLNVSNNNFPPSDLSVFKILVNLEGLDIKNNKFHGSLATLRDLTKLKWLDTSDTNLNSGLEYLSAGLKTIYCANTPFELYLKDFKKLNNRYDYSAWKKTNLSLIEQIQEHDKLLKIFKIIDSVLERINTTKELTKSEQVLQVLKFYLEEETQAIKKQLYVNQVQVTS